MITTPVLQRPFIFHLLVISGILFFGSCTKPLLLRNDVQLPSIKATGGTMSLLSNPTIANARVGTFAGNGIASFFNGTPSSSEFNAPFAVAADAAGTIYIADRKNHMIRKITAAGIVSTLAGTGQAGFQEGEGIAAQFSSPSGVAVDAAGNVYVADQGNNRIRKITTAGQVSTLAGSGQPGHTEGPALTAQFKFPTGVAIDAAGNVYVADSANQCIRKISSAGLVTTLCGNGNQGYGEGPPAFAQFNNPVGVAVNAAGTVYVADQGNNRIRAVTPAGVASTFAGDGNAAFKDDNGGLAEFHSPMGVTVDAAGNVYVADSANHRIRKITPAKTVSTLAGDGNAAFRDDAGSLAEFHSPTGVAVDVAGNIYIADQFNNRIRQITFVKIVSVLAGDGARGYRNGPGAMAEFNSPTGVTVDAAGNIYVAEQAGQRIRKITPAGVVSNFAGNGVMGFAEGSDSTAQFSYPTGIATDASGNVYVADALNARIRKITPAGVVSTLAGTTAGFTNGSSSVAQFRFPMGVAVDATGNVYVADFSNSAIRKITPAGQVSTLAGTGTIGSANGPGNVATFNGPSGVAVDAGGNVYVADLNNNLIRKITPDGLVSNLAGSGVQGFANGVGAGAMFWAPYGITVDPAGNVYVGDRDNKRIRKITPAGLVSTLAGSGAQGSFNGAADLAQFFLPTGLAVDASGTVYVADAFNFQIRVIQ